MLTEERRQVILDRLARDGRVVVADLSSSLDMSLDTIRRDLQELADAGLVRRVHGGALPPAVGSRTYAARREQAPAAKAAIADATVDLLRDGQVILLDAGTTTLEVARHLPGSLQATVITNSPPIAVALAEHPSVEVTMLGGILDKDAQALVGAATVEALRSVRADVLILGVCSVHPEIGITVPDLEESYVKRAMIANAVEVVAVSSADKLGSAGPYVVGSVDELTHLVTEHSSALPDLDPYRALGVEVVWPDADESPRDRAVLPRRRAADRLLGRSDPRRAAACLAVECASRAGAVRGLPRRARGDAARRPAVRAHRQQARHAPRAAARIGFSGRRLACDGPPGLAAALFGFGAAFGSINVSANAQGLALERLSGRPLLSSFHAAFSAGGLVGAGLAALAAGMELEPRIHFAVLATALTAIGIAAVRFCSRPMPTTRPRAARSRGRRGPSSCSVPRPSARCSRKARRSTGAPSTSRTRSVPRQPSQRWPTRPSRWR